MLALALCASGAVAQDKPKIEITPQIPHSFIVWSVAFSPDGTRVLSGCIDKTLRLWDAGTGQQVRVVEWSADGAWALVARDGQKIGYLPKDALLKIRQ